VVTREELAEQVWGSDTYVDFEHGLNFAIRKIRSVLEDDPEQPRFVETIPKRGYRFIAAVRNLPEAARTPIETPHSRVAPNRVLYAIAAVLLFGAIGTIWYVRGSWLGKASAAQIRSLAVLPLRNLSNDPEQEYFSDVHDG